MNTLRMEHVERWFLIDGVGHEHGDNNFGMMQLSMNAKMDLSIDSVEHEQVDDELRNNTRRTIEDYRTLMNIIPCGMQETIR